MSHPGIDGYQGPSTNEITDFWDAHKSDPEAIRNAMAQYGVSNEQVAAATGQDVNGLVRYLNGPATPAPDNRGWFTDTPGTVSPAPSAPAMSYEQYLARVQPWMLDAQGKFKGPSSGVNFMLEGMTPEEAFRNAQSQKSVDIDGGGNTAYQNIARTQLLDPSWRNGPAGTGIVNAVGHMAGEITKNPALMAAFTAGVVNPAMSSAVSSTPLAGIAKIPGAMQGLTSLVTTGDPIKALKAGVLGVGGQYLTNGVSDLITDNTNLPESTAGALARTGVGALTGGVPGALNAAAKSMGRSPATTVNTAPPAPNVETSQVMGVPTEYFDHPPTPVEETDNTLPQVTVTGSQNTGTQLDPVTVIGKRATDAQLDPVTVIGKRTPDTVLDPVTVVGKRPEVNWDFPVPEKPIVPPVKLGEPTPAVPKQKLPSPKAAAPASSTPVSGPNSTEPSNGTASYAPLANVFYAGKDFSSKKQRLNAKGQLLDDEYNPLSVTKAGAELRPLSNDTVANTDETKENPVSSTLAVLGVPDVASMAALFGID